MSDKINNTAILLLFIILNTGGSLIAQNTMSPYSLFGPGEIIYKGFGRSVGMGRSGFALASDNRLNNLNPASYSGINKKRFIFEIGLDGKYSDFATYSNDYDGFNGNLRYIALAVHINDWLSSSLGLVPFSSVGYNIYTKNTIEGTLNEYTTLLSGSGGITSAYIGNAFKITKNLSLGINTSYIFGPLEQTENISYPGWGIDYTITTNDYLRAFYFDYGLQYKFSYKAINYSFGFIYANAQSLRSTHFSSLLNENLVTIDSKTQETGSIKLPEVAGFGFAISKPDKYTLTADYQVQKWSGLTYPVMAGQFRNSHTFSAGYEIIPWKKSILNTFYKTWTYRVGGNYNQSYLIIRNKNIDGYAINFGVGIPLYNQESTVNIAFEAGSNGTTQNNLARERYLLMHLNFSINDIWFIKNKYY